MGLLKAEDLESPMDQSGFYGRFSQSPEPDLPAAIYYQEPTGSRSILYITAHSF